MWGIVIGLVGIGLWLWDHATDKTPLALPPGAAREPVTPGARAALVARAAQCGLLQGDMRDAERWVEKYLGPVEVLAGLKMMTSIVHASQWPLSARRVFCTYLGGAVPPPYAGQQIRDAVFPRYGG
jgi:hypothetical protein